VEYGKVLRSARSQAGLTVSALADRAGTSRATLSAYEHGRKAPMVTTFERIVNAAGFAIALEPLITFRQVAGYRGRTITVPSQLPQRPVPEMVTLPSRVLWSGKRRMFDLSNRDDRAIAYEAIMTNGEAQDILDFINADLLVEIFDQMYLPPATRKAWQSVVDLGRDGD